MPEDLYVTHADPGPAPAGGRVLVHQLSGFLDAGGAARLAGDHLLKTCEHRLLATFDTDALLDYRARRPRMTFLRDHFASVDLPRITLHELRDAAGRPFLLLTGPEPDYRWEGFVDAVAGIVERLEVTLAVGLSGIPWPAPHTRPLGVTVHGTDPSLTAGNPVWVGSLEVPGHVAGLLELRLGEGGHPAMGLAAHIPHYLVQFEYPRSAMLLVERLAAATGLQLPVDALVAGAESADAEIAAQLASNEEFAGLVAALELQYDAAGPDGPRLNLADQDDAAEASAEPVPSADEIGAAVERFLAAMDEQGRDG